MRITVRWNIEMTNWYIEDVSSNETQLGLCEKREDFLNIKTYGGYHDHDYQYSCTPYSSIRPASGQRS